MRSFADWSQNLTFSRLRLLYSDGKTVALGTVFVNIFDNLNYVWAHIEIFIEYTKNKNVFLLNCFGGIFILIFRKVLTFNVYGLKLFSNQFFFINSRILISPSKNFIKVCANIFI